MFLSCLSGEMDVLKALAPIFGENSVANPESYY
jgi:hypothetical protein